MSPPGKMFTVQKCSLEEELDLLEQSSSTSCHCHTEVQLKERLKEAISKINELNMVKSRLESDLHNAKRDIEERDADLVRAHEEIQLTKTAVDRTRQQSDEYRHEMERVREEHRNYVIENAYLRQKELEDDTPRVVLSMMRSGRKNGPLVFPLPENHPHYPNILKNTKPQ